MIALSTAWVPKRSARLAKVLAAGRRIGFTSFELGVSDVPFDLDAVRKAIDRRGIRIVSIHAVCCEGGVPGPTRRGDWVAEPDEARRRHGVRLVRETLDIARRVGATAVVLHGGVLPVPDLREYQIELYRLMSRGADTGHLQKPLQRLLEQRARMAPAYLRALEASLEELCGYAPDVRIGLENRYYLSDLPHRDEFEAVFDRVSAPNLGYWHDVGHAHLIERLGFADQLEWLGRYADRLVGIHLHDIRGVEDHRPPGTGDFNFAALTDYLRPDVLRVLEIASGHSARAVRKSRDHLAEMYGIA